MGSEGDVGGGGRGTLRDVELSAARGCTAMWVTVPSLRGRYGLAHSWVIYESEDLADFETFPLFVRASARDNAHFSKHLPPRFT